jgi:hypothetical protein
VASSIEKKDYNMMKQKLLQLSSAILVSLVITVLSLSPVLAYLYRAPFVITESSSIAYTMLPVFDTVDNVWLANNGFMLPTALDTRIETLGGSAKPHMVAGDRTLTAVTIPSSSQTNLYFSTGNTALSAMNIITGYNGFLTTPDTAALELGNNFNVNVDGWLSSYTATATPAVAAVNGGNDVVNSTSHTVNLPAGISTGDLLLVVFASDSNPTITFPANWYNLDTTSSGAATTMAIYYKIADGSDGATITVTTSNNQMTAHTSFRITGGQGVEIGTAATDTDASPDPGELRTRFGTLNNLWIAVSGNDVGTTTVTGYPAGYADTRNDRSNDAEGVGIGTARLASTTDNNDPGVFTLSGAQDWIANIVCISPVGMLVGKQGSFYVYTDSSGEVTAMLPQTTTSETLYPSGVGDETNISVVTGAATHWQATSDTNDATYVATSSAAYLRDLYECGDSTGTGAITSVVVCTRVWDDTAAAGSSMTAIRASGVVHNGAPVATPGVALTRSTTYTTNPTTGLPWTWAEVDGMQIGVSLSNADGDPPPEEDSYCSEVYAVINYNPSIYVTASGLSIVEHDISVTADGTDVNLYVDSVLEDTEPLSGLSVLDTASNWIIGSGNTLPYMGYYRHTVGGVLVNWYQPVTIIRGENYSTGTVTVTNGDATVTGAGGATWDDGMIGSLFVSADGVRYVVSSVTDATHLELNAGYFGGTLAGQDYNMYVKLPDRQSIVDARITWGANPAGIVVALGSMVAGSQSSVGSTETGTPANILPPVSVSDWFGDGTVAGATLTNPLRPFITMVSDNTTLSEIQVWRWLGLAMLLFVTVACARLLREHQGITAIIAAVTMGGLVAFDHNIFPMWLLVLSIGIFVGGLISERSPSL